MGNSNIVRRCLVPVVACGGLVLACHQPPATPPDPCVAMGSADGASAQIGFGSAFTPVTDGQHATLQLGVQGLWMFVMNVHAEGLELGSGDQQGAVFFDAIQNGSSIAAVTGCHPRDFAAVDGTTDGLVDPYFLPMVLTAPQLANTMVTITLAVGDVGGRRVVDQHTVIVDPPAQ